MPEVPARMESPGAALEVLDKRIEPIVEAVARAARDAGSPAVRLERALEILFDAYAGADPGFSALLLEGWVRAQRDKQYRLRLAWQREQIRLCLRDILAEGAATRSFRADLDPETLAAIILNAAEGCLLQSATQGGPVTAEQLLRALLRLVISVA
jgi:hypothetical protein